MVIINDRSNVSNRTNAGRSNGGQQRNTNDTIRCDLLEQIGVIGEKKDGWTREVNIVSWNNGPAKVDVRDWDPNHSRMSKGITLLEEEAENLVKVLARRYGISLTNYTPVFTPREDQSANQQGAAAAGSAGELYESAAADDAPDTPFIAATGAGSFDDDSAEDGEEAED